MTLRSFFLLGASIAALATAIAACSSDSGDTGASSGFATSSTGGGGASTGTNGKGGGVPDSSTAALMPTSSSGASGGAGGGCVGVSAKAEPIPLDILLMVDQSGSMLTDSGNGTSRWNTIKTAIGAFVQEPESAGIGLGINYFGQPQVLNETCKTTPCTTDADCNGCFDCDTMSGFCVSTTNTDVDSCNGADYTDPEVTIQPLPGVGAAILTSLGQHSPGTNTPTYPALLGAVAAQIDWTNQHPGHVSAVAFATDGEPSECDIDPDHIDTIAAMGLSNVPSVRTFVIGVGPALTALDAIAAAGGTTEAFHVDVNAMAEQELLDALNTIRGVAVACTYTIPDPPSGMELDPSQVNVSYVPGDGSSSQSIPHVTDASMCPSSGKAWYYDDATNPTEVILCDATCATVAKDFTAEMNVVFGCSTILF